MRLKETIQIQMRYNLYILIMTLAVLVTAGCSETGKVSGLGGVVTSVTMSEVEGVDSFMRIAVRVPGEDSACVVRIAMGGDMELLADTLIGDSSVVLTLADYFENDRVLWLAKGSGSDTLLVSPRFDLTSIGLEITEYRELRPLGVYGGTLTLSRGTDTICLAMNPVVTDSAGVINYYEYQ